MAKLLREYAQGTALRGGNPYRAKAYSRAADSLAALAEPLDKLIMEERLTEIPGIGEAIADIVTKLYQTGTHPSLEKLRKEIPAGVLELLVFPGCGRKRFCGSTRIWASPHWPNSKLPPRKTASRRARVWAPRSRRRSCRIWRSRRAAQEACICTEPLASSITRRIRFGPPGQSSSI